MLSRWKCDLHLLKSGCHDRKPNEVCNAFSQEVLNNQKRDQIVLFKSGCYDQHNAMKARFAILVCIFSSLVAMTLKHNEVCNAFSQEVLNNQKRDQIVLS